MFTDIELVETIITFRRRIVICSFLAESLHVRNTVPFRISIIPGASSTFCIFKWRMQYV